MPIENALRSSMFLRNSRGALIPSNIHWTFSVRLIRFTAKGEEESGSQPLQETKDDAFTSGSGEPVQIEFEHKERTGRRNSEQNGKNSEQSGKNSERHFV